VSQLLAFITFWQNSLNDWVRREIIDDDPWDEQISDLPDDKEEPKTSAIESVPEADTPQADTPESDISMIHQ
jgi:hypothetical protein